MKKALYIALLLISWMSAGQTIVIEDSSFRQCLIDSMPSVIIGNELDTAASRTQGGVLDCQGYDIKDLSPLNYFDNLFRVSFSGLEVDNINPIASIESLKQIDIHDSSLGDVPDFSHLDLQLAVMVNSGLTEFPLFNDSIAIILVDDNHIPTLLGLERYVALEQLMANTNDIDSISGLESLEDLRFLFLGSNELKSLPSLANSNNLTRLHLYNNKLTEVKGLDNKPNLWNINISANQFEDMPNLDNTFPTNFRFRINKLTFEDMMQYENRPGFPDFLQLYDDQGKQGIKDTVMVTESHSWSWTLDFDQSVTSNYYLWYKDSTLIDSTTTGTLTIDLVTPSSAGSYHCDVRNTNFDTASIIVRPRLLEVLDFPGYEDPVAFSPNGDGDNDDLYIENEGTIKIYTDRGELVKTMQGPGIWDGSFSTGELGSLGFYIIMVDDEREMKATLVR